MKASTFVLHGGSNHLLIARNLGYWRAMQTAREEVTACVIPYAAHTPGGPGQDAWMAPYFERELRESFEMANPHRRLVEVLVPAPADLEAAVARADLIYVPGGDGDRLQAVLAPLMGRLRPLLLDGKTIAGTSAGSNLWAERYYSNDNQRVMDGFGLLEAKTFCHYETSKWPRLNELIRCLPELPVIPLAENEYAVISPV